MKNHTVLWSFIFIIQLSVNAQPISFTDLKGAYLGEKSPGNEAVLFSKGIISSDSIEHSSPAFSPDGNTVLWTVIYRFKKAFLLEMKKINGTWTKPAPPSFADSTADDFYPSFSPDGKQLYFNSRRTTPDGYPKTEDIRIWTVSKEKDGWGKPKPFDTTVSTGIEYAHSVTTTGNIYFSFRKDGGKIFDIAVSKKKGDHYLPPVSLTNGINTEYYEDGPFIAPDESYLIFESNRPGGIEESIDLYISFRKKDGSFTSPKNMGPAVNSKFAERFARVSPDGKYLFFGSTRSGMLDVYWIDAGIINVLKRDITGLL